MPVAKVLTKDGYPVLMVDGEPVAPMAMTVISNVDRGYLRRLGEAGIRLFYVPCSMPWADPKAMEELIERTDALLDAVPDAYIMLRVMLHPSLDWIQANPDQMVTYNNGNGKSLDFISIFYRNGEGIPAMYSLASQKWRDEAGAGLAEFIGLVNQQPFSSRVIGYFLGAGGTSEWYYPHGSVDTEHGCCADFSEAFRLNFSSVLREKYATEEALREAWNMDDIGFDNAPIPDLPSRRFSWVDNEVFESPGRSELPPADNGTHVGSFLDLDHCQSVADFYRAWHYGTADSIIHFSRIVKKQTANQCVTGAFFGGSRSYVESGNSAGVSRVIESGAVDFLACPCHYENRKPGGTNVQRQMQDSMRLRGVLFVSEEDTRTQLSAEPYRISSGVHTLADALTKMKREFARNICEDTHAWWFDMAIKDKGEAPWYDHPDILALIRRQQQVAQMAYASDRRKPAEIAFIYDEESMYHVSQNTSEDLIKTFRMMENHRIGVPVDYYNHNDLANPDMPDYKLYVFVNVFNLTETERDAVTAKVKRNGNIVLWMYAQGFICPDRSPKLSPEYISELVGMDMQMDNAASDPRFKLIKPLDPLLAQARADRTQGYFDRPFISGGMAGNEAGPTPNTLLYPLFYPGQADPHITVLGRYLDNDKPALAARRFDDWTSVYCGTKTIGSDVLRSLASAAGCHVYCDSDDQLYANNRFVAIHAAKAGRKHIQFPVPCDPYEVYKMQSYGRGVTGIEVDMAENETLMFHLNGTLQSSG
ncbi:MAG: hypothetical protein K8S55_03690 [Phycisphaerae bacterium]|nr:hypothetical protein [Phycisphaerae bacterium]